MNAQEQARAFNLINKAYAAKGKANVVLVQSVLRLEQSLSTSQTTYKFSILENEGLKKPTEIRLNQNDAFTAIGTRLSFGLAADANDVAFLPQIYPDKNVLTTAGAEAAIKALYTSTLRVNINRQDYVLNWDFLKHYKAVQTQFALTTDPNIDYSKDGIVSNMPYLNFSGAGTTLIELSLKKAVGTLQEGVDTRIILEFYGFLAQQASSFQV